MIALIPIIIGLYYGHRLKTYEAIFSIVFLFLIFDGDHWEQGVNLLIWLVYEFALTFAYQYYRHHGKK